MIGTARNLQTNTHKIGLRNVNNYFIEYKQLPQICELLEFEVLTVIAVGLRCSCLNFSLDKLSYEHRLDLDVRFKFRYIGIYTNSTSSYI